MNPDTVYAKTEKGKERFEARDIPTNLRHALILVDGRSTLTELLKKGEGLALLEDSLEMLEEMGLMAPVGSISAASAPNPATQPATGSSPVKRHLMALAMSILGDKAEKIVKKIEETMDSNVALMNTIDSCGKVIKLTIDEKKAEAFVTAARDIMAKNG